MATKFYTEQKKTNNKSTTNKSDASMRPSTSKSTIASSTPSTSSDNKIQDAMCIAEGCNKAAVSHPEWDNEYCSVDCCYNHCKTTFQAWLTANRIANTKTSTTVLIPECVAGPSHQSGSVKP